MTDYRRITDRKIELTDEGVEELVADYTPTTGHVRARYVRDDANFLTDWAEFDRWLAEVKAEAWEEGAVWQRANAIPDDRRMKARFVSELQTVNPYREGKK